MDVITGVWAPKINSDSAGGSLRGVDTCAGLTEEASFHLGPAAHQAGGASPSGRWSQPACMAEPQFFAPRLRLVVILGNASTLLSASHAWPFLTHTTL